MAEHIDKNTASLDFGGKYGHNPAHLAILENRKPPAISEFLTGRNIYGLTPPVLAKLLNREHLLEKPSLSPLSLKKEFMRKYEVEYVPGLIFASPKELFWMLKKCARAVERGIIDRTQRWLGVFYEKEIMSGQVPAVEIRWIGPKPGYGLFTKKALEKGAYIGEYAGLVRRAKKKSDSKNSYCFEYLIGCEKKTPLTIDAKEKGNYLRFANHSDHPNCAPAPIFSTGVMHIILRANKNIPQGVELTYDYGPQYWAKREKPI